MKHVAAIASLGVAAAFGSAAMAQTASDDGTIIPLYAKGQVTSLGVPETREKLSETGETMIFNISDPTLALFRPASGHANGTAVIIAPGGGFVGLGYDDGGTAIAHRLAERGVTALVLKYRTIRSPNTAMHMPDVHIKEMDTIMARAKSGLPVEVPPFAGEKHAVEDGARAMTIVRNHAKEWGVDPQRIGFIGFSSGAFLAADLAIGDKATRPNFVGLFYGGLRTPVPADASPAFIAAAADDEYLPNDSLQLFSAWRKAGAPAELHIYEHGGHGFTLKPKGTTSDHWIDELLWWMQSRGLLGSENHLDTQVPSKAELAPAGVAATTASRAASNFFMRLYLASMTGHFVKWLQWVAISTGQRNTPTLCQQKVRCHGIQAQIHRSLASRLEAP